MKSQVKIQKNTTEVSLSKKFTMIALLAIGSVGMVNAQTTPVKTIAAKTTAVKSTTTKTITEKTNPIKETKVKTETVKEVKMGMHKKPIKTLKATATTVETKKVIPVKAKSN